MQIHIEKINEGAYIFSTASKFESSLLKALVAAINTFRDSYYPVDHEEDTPNNEEIKH